MNFFKKLLFQFHSQAGFSVLEVMLAAAMFVIFSTGIIGVVLQGFDANRTGSEETIANQYASEGIEAARSIKNQGFSFLVNSAGTGVIRNGSSVWAFSGANNTFGKYTRVITVADTQRDASGNIVASGGTVDQNTKKITSTASWNVSPTRNNSVVLTTYLTAWKSGKNGMLVYGDGGTTTDAVKYQTFDGGTKTWGAATAAFDVDTGSTDRALRAVKVYSSSTRNEKIVISRHYRITGTVQAIYATVWNGSSWGVPLQLSTWTASTFLDVLNFDGAYLSDGKFMAIYSDNTNIPKYRIWDGTSWGAQGSLTALPVSHTPVYIVASARPGSTEVMAGIFTNGAGTVTAGNTITEYWNSTTWSATTVHAAASITNTKRFIDFEWSPSSPTTGILAYTDNTTDKNMTIRICTASAGVCTWGTAVNSGTAQTNNMGAINIEPRPTANEFQACDKDAAATPTIVCYKVTFNGTTPTFSAPVIVAAATDVGIQRSFDIDWESTSGDPLLMVYSNNSATPQFKIYLAGAWGGATPIVTTGSTPGVIKTVRIIPQDQADDMMVLMADANLDVYGIFWNGDGATNAMYTTPASKVFTGHGINGSATTDFWYDFAWDKY